MYFIDPKMASINDNVVLGSNDHASKFSIRFMELLQEKELIDVVLVADDQLFPAHRLILSTVSPSFRKMFKQMPVNQQAYVFMNGVSKQTMDNLINFMYNGEVKLHQDFLADFLEKAKSLEIDGIFNDNYWQTSAQRQPNDMAQNVTAPSYTGIQYQSAHVNRFSISSGAIATSQQPHANQFAYDNCSDYAESNAGNFNEMEENNESGGNYYDTMDRKFDHQHIEWDDNENKATANRIKRTKPNNDYDIVADIQLNAKGGENLFYQNQMFSKHGPINSLGKQRWQCSKNSSKNPCKAAASTISVNDVIMMKVLSVEHSH